MRFYGVNITYSLQTPNVSCYAMKITQRHEDKYGILYVNDSVVLRRPDCKEIQYPVLAKEEWSSKEAWAYITVVLDGACKLSLDFGLSHAGVSKLWPGAISCLPQDLACSNLNVFPQLHSQTVNLCSPVHSTPYHMAKVVSAWLALIPITRAMCFKTLKLQLFSVKLSPADKTNQVPTSWVFNHTVKQLWILHLHKQTMIDQVFTIDRAVTVCCSSLASTLYKIDFFPCGNM